MVRLVDSIVDETQRDLKEIEATGTLANAKVVAELKKRTLVDKQYESQQRKSMMRRTLNFYFIFVSIEKQPPIVYQRALISLWKSRRRVLISPQICFNRKCM